MDKVTGTKQIGQDDENMIAKTGQRGQKKLWTRKAGAGPLEQDSHFEIAGTG
jgi:hypothetical protein